MSNKEIKAWKNKVTQGKTVFVAAKLKKIHPVIDKISIQLLKIDLIQYLRITPDDLQASNEIKIIGRTKKPISKPNHPTAIGLHLILDFDYGDIQFFEITSAIKGYGERMVRAIVTSIPEDWKAVVVMDWSRGFWDKMAKKYDNIVIL
jgi:hypothetical protein